MGALIPNIAKGRPAHYASLPAANDALVWVLFSGTETDANLRDADHLTAVIALAVDEATFTGYARVTATGVVVTIDDANDRVDIDVADPSWNPTGGSQALKRIGLFYDPDTTGGTDSDLVPIFIDDYDVPGTPTSGSLVYQVNSAGAVRAA